MESLYNETKFILNKYGIHANKSLGQNFLINNEVVSTIIESANISNKDLVIEIGPGIGALTEQIAKVAKEVYAFEIDERFLTVLDDTLSPYSNVTVIHQDILDVDFEAFQKEYLADVERLVVIANLPYYITPIYLYIHL